MESISFGVAVLGAGARVRQQVRRLRHRLHAAGDDDSNSPARMSWSASAIASRPERHTLLSVTDGTDIGMPPFDRRLAGRDLAGAGLDDVTHDHVVDLVAGDAGALEGAP